MSKEKMIEHIRNCLTCQLLICERCEKPLGAHTASEYIIEFAYPYCEAMILTALYKNCPSQEFLQDLCLYLEEYGYTIFDGNLK